MIDVTLRSLVLNSDYSAVPILRQTKTFHDRQSLILATFDPTDVTQPRR
jgi:hypothetical protein